MPTISGTDKPRTHQCSRCGVFLWNEGVCDPCNGVPAEAEVKEVKAVTYEVDARSHKVVARNRRPKHG